jgi:hypothetical protein
MYVYAGPVAVCAAVVSIIVNVVLCVPVWLVALVRYTYSRCKREQEDDAFNEEKLWRMLRFYFMSLCIVVYFAPLLAIAAAAATCVLVIQIIAIPRTILMYRDTESLEFLIDDCRSLFELFVHIIGSIPAAVIALATFPLGAGILLLNHVEVSEDYTRDCNCCRHKYAIVIICNSINCNHFCRTTRLSDVRLCAALFKSERPGNTSQQIITGGV